MDGIRIPLVCLFRNGEIAYHGAFIGAAASVILGCMGRPGITCQGGKHGGTDKGGTTVADC